MKTLDSAFDNNIDIDTANRIGLEQVNQGSIPVNVIVGRYQPPTTGHTKVISRLATENGFPVWVFVVRSSKRNLDKSPFSYKLIDDMMNTLVNDGIIAGYSILPRAFIGDILNTLREIDREPVLWGTGTDRLESYEGQIDRYYNALNLRPDFSFHEIERSDSDVSATKVRDLLQSGLLDDAKMFMPIRLHKFAKSLSKEIKQFK